MDILLIMCAGVLVGKFLIPLKMKKGNERISFLCTLLLIFSMGVMLGQKDGFIEELSSLGLSSFLFFLLPTLLSVLLVYFLTKQLMERRTHKTFCKDLDT